MLIAFIVGLLGMEAAQVVTVLLGGVPIPTSRPAWLDARGFVFTPLDPIVVRLAQVVEIDREEGHVTLRRDDKSVVVRFGPDAIAEPDGTIYVRLGPVVRGLGGTATFDAVRKVVTIEMPQAQAVSTPTPFQPANPTVAPTTIFTPQPTVTPRPTPSGAPQPRRTPVPVVPSYPSPS